LVPLVNGEKASSIEGNFFYKSDKWAGINSKNWTEYITEKTNKLGHLVSAAMIHAGLVSEIPEPDQNLGRTGSVFSTGRSSKEAWIIDSGASDHMTFCKNDITDNIEPRKREIINANGKSSPVTGAGTIHISPSMTLSNTLLVPSLTTKLLSVGQICEERNYAVLMYPKFCLFQDILTKEIIGRGSKRGGLYHLEDINEGSAFSTSSLFSNCKNKVLVWHKRLGHPSFGYMKNLFPELFVNCENHKFECETCIKAKSHRVPYPKSLNKCRSLFDLVHSDVWGPAPITSKTQHKWFVLFIDDCTRMTWLYLLKNKNEVIDVFQSFYKMIYTQFGKKVKMVRSDNGGEFVNKTLKIFFNNEGVLHETSCVGTPQQNGVAERKNRHVLETARALLLEYNVPKQF
jgi:GAG-pre-integrase domain/Integrase core domain